MGQDKTPLVWIDMEMSGLVPEKERILEVAMLVTDADLNEIAAAPVLVIHQPDAVLDAMDSWNRSTHGKSGLVDKVRASTLDEAAAEKILVDFLKPIVAARMAPLCGNTVHQDRRFMARYMPALDEYLHYRIIEFLKPIVASGSAPLAGNTVHQDRRFMARYMPAFDAYLHYRIVDVSTLKELAKRWRPDVIAGFAKEGKHEALADIQESIEELKHYRATFLRIEPPPA